MLEIFSGLFSEVERRHIDEDVTVFQDFGTLLGDTLQRRMGFAQPGRNLQASYGRRASGVRVVPLFGIFQKMLDMRFQLNARVIPVEPFDFIRALSVVILFVEHPRAPIHCHPGEAQKAEYFSSIIHDYR